jgi:hypothetical protein
MVSSSDPSNMLHQIQFFEAVLLYINNYGDKEKQKNSTQNTQKKDTYIRKLQFESVQHNYEN